ncbi:MAG: hypothetical protein PHF51_04160 [Candidatus ainarchaeum sp.]|nr:hypothetical protein [Candidatus ainarchaeum sp.]
MDDKRGLAAGIVVLACVVVTLAVYFLGITSARALDFPELLVFAPLSLIIVFAGYVLWERGKAAKAGLPATDELAKKASYKAGYYAFIVAIWSSLAASIFGLPGHEVTAAVVLCSAITFVAAYVYLARKGKVD